MYASRDIEFEQGTSSGRRRRHNGYYAGDFSDRPLPSQESLRQLAAMTRPRAVVAPGVGGGVGRGVGMAVGRSVVGGW